ncbi:MAG: hypothetical protein QOF20_2124 [Acidimicrobiaceae bacterium]|nr:hypothetical protein [Acidimicrobiaceae bacterium]
MAKRTPESSQYRQSRVARHGGWIVLAGLGLTIACAGCAARHSTGSAAPTTAFNPLTTVGTNPEATTATTRRQSEPAQTLPSNSLPLDSTDTCDSSLDKAITRKLAYQPSNHMTVGRPTRVMVVLGTNALPTDVITGSDSTTIVPIQTTCEVQVQLTGAPGIFLISPAGFESQSFIDGPVLIWTWQVTPEKPGNGLKLELKVQSVFRSSGGATLPGKVLAYDASISVDAAGSSSGNQASKFLNAPIISALVASISAAILIAIFPSIRNTIFNRIAWIRRRRGTTHGEGDSEDNGDRDL